MKLRALAVLLLATGAAQGYYHFLQYAQRDGRLTGLPQRFNLDALTARTVPFFISRGPDKQAPTDSLTSLVSQIELAARQWSDVDTSELRLQFGGFTDAGAQAGDAPGIDIVFEEVPPGLIAVAGPTVTGPARVGDGFVPVRRSMMILPKDMSNLPSHAEATFLTLVHEFGHTIGLQHSMTSSAMATQLTRTQSKGNALSADDVAGVSILYPTRAFRSNLGSIKGRVAEGGSGRPLASVVAISASGFAVGALTGPDGTYLIEGLPPARYIVYAHPLPPAQGGESTPANLRLPLDRNGDTIEPGSAFELLFFPGVRQHNDATQIPVGAGAVIDDVNFQVRSRDPLRLYNVLAYSFPGQLAVRPAYVNVNGTRNFFVATGIGLLDGEQPASDLRAAIVGGATGVSSVESYSPGFLRFNLVYSDDSGVGPRHLVVSTPTGVYVQPRAFLLATQQPPRIEAISVGDGGTLVLSGTGLSPQSRIFFDGAAALIRSADADAGTVTVEPPPGPSGHRAIVTAINPDGQNSLFLQNDAPPATFLEAPTTFGISISPSRLPAGSESVVEINGTNTGFVEGRISVGFGTSEITVRRVWVLSETRLLVQVRVAPQASLSPVTVSVRSGLRTFSAPGAFAAGSSQPSRLEITSTSTNASTGIVSGPAGGTVVLLVGGASGSAPPKITVGDIDAAVSTLAPSIYSVQLPAELPTGPALLRVQTADAESLPLAVQVEGPTPRILEITTLGGLNVDSQRPVQPGDSILLRLNSPVKATNPFEKIRATVTVAGVDHLAQVTDAGTVRFTLLPSVAAGAQPMTLRVNGRVSVPETLAVRY